MMARKRTHGSDGSKRAALAVRMPPRLVFVGLSLLACVSPTFGQPDPAAEPTANENYLRAIGQFESASELQSILYDALYDMLGADETARLMEHGTIEIAPLAYMRGRTLNDAYVILDEAQNTSPEQMKMFLTRLGFNSKMVITGDVTQIDLPSGRGSGLKLVRGILRGIPGISFVDLTARDVVRAKIVADIVEAYGRYDENGSDA